MILGLVIALIMAIVTWVSISSRQRQLDDPTDDKVVHLEQLHQVCKLQSGGEYLLRTLRQSGNLQKDDQFFDSHELALKTAISTFKRAKIDYILITKNSEVEFFFRRPYYHHGGSAEGKKVGSIEIYKVG